MKCELPRPPEPKHWAKAARTMMTPETEGVYTLGEWTM